MSEPPFRGTVAAAIAVVLLVAFAPATRATWSIVAVDRNTGEVGSAGASCTPFVAGILGIAPGYGVLVDQSVSDGSARRLGLAKMRKGETPTAIVEAMTDPAVRPDFERGQLGVVTLEHSETPAAFTGNEASQWRGQLAGPGFSVQGNILVGEQVVAAAYRAFEETAGRPLSDRLLAALKAGSIEGGDSRCGEQTAQSAYLVVAVATDRPNSSSRAIVTPFQRGSENPVLLLEQQYEDGEFRTLRLLPWTGLEFGVACAVLPPVLGLFVACLFRWRPRTPAWIGLAIGAFVPPLVLATGLGGLSAFGFATGVWLEAVLVLLAVNSLTSALLFGAVEGGRRLIARRPRRRGE